MGKTGNILVVDDDEYICDSLFRVIKDMGHDVECVKTLGQGKQSAESGLFDVVLLDVRLPDGNGLEAIDFFQTTPSEPEIVIMTGFADGHGAEQAIKNKAWDYIKKPASIETIRLTINRALLYRSEKSTNKSRLGIKRRGIIGDSPKIQRSLDLVAKAANNTANILITGETGTGKELFARAIHENSPRAKNRFVVVDCAALPETLAESLLLGHTKGAFTGANKDEEGLVMYADGGTLFLDEIGELPFAMQKGFLRVLQERRFSPIGGTAEKESDFRLISATNRNLDQMIGAGTFREDLLFRIRSISINLPALRDRSEDIKPLIQAYLHKLCESNQVEMKAVSPDFFDVLGLYNWPGNIRELYSTLEYAFFHAQYENTLFPKHLPTHIRAYVFRTLFDDQPVEKSQVDRIVDDTPGQIGKWKDFRKTHLEKVENGYLRSLMEQTGSNIKKASRVSGLSGSRLYDLLKKHNLSES